MPHQAMARHQVIIGSCGSGKTSLMIRTWAGWYTAARHAAERRRAPPAAGGHGLQGRTRRPRQGHPHRRPAPRRRRRHRQRCGRTRQPCRCGRLPPRDLAVTLFQLLDTSSEGPAAYYADITQAALTLAVTAPPGPPSSGSEFLDRLDDGWLERAYAGDWARLGAVRAAARHLPDVALRYRTLLDRLGPGFDGTATLGPAPTRGI